MAQALLTSRKSRPIILLVGIFLGIVVGACSDEGVPQPEYTFAGGEDTDRSGDAEVDSNLEIDQEAYAGESPPADGGDTAATTAGETDSSDPGGDGATDGTDGSDGDDPAPPLPDPTAALTVNGAGGPLVLEIGSEVSLEWTSTDTEGCTLEPAHEGFDGAASGSLALTALASTIYNLTCMQGEKVATASFEIAVQCTATPMTVTTGRNSMREITVPCDGMIRNVTDDDETATTVIRDDVEHVVHICDEYDDQLSRLGFSPANLNSCYNLNDTNDDLGFVCDPADDSILLRENNANDSGECNVLHNVNVPVKRGDRLRVWRGDNSGGFGIRVFYTPN